jgi:hypothetical protein
LRKFIEAIGDSVANRSITSSPLDVSTSTDIAAFFSFQSASFVPVVLLWGIGFLSVSRHFSNSFIILLRNLTSIAAAPAASVPATEREIYIFARTRTTDRSTETKASSSHK